jgi:hypothetical protein
MQAVNLVAFLAALYARRVHTQSWGQNPHLFFNQIAAAKDDMTAGM